MYLHGSAPAAGAGGMVHPAQKVRQYVFHRFLQRRSGVPLPRRSDAQLIMTILLDYFAFCKFFTCQSGAFFSIL
jgi:hypothetical protein